MYLSNRDIKWAIHCHKLIVDPPPDGVTSGYDETSIDLHLGPIKTALVWDVGAYMRATGAGGRARPELELGQFAWDDLSERFLTAVPEQQGPDDGSLVFRRGPEIVVRKFGFLLWTTKEKVGTPKIEPHRPGPQRHPELICFVDGKSTRARTGLLVHFTAPTIHAGWAGNITLEITNLGPFDFVLREGDAISQLTVATISSAPDMSLRKSKQQTQDQTTPAAPKPGKAKRSK